MLASFARTALLAVALLPALSWSAPLPLTLDEAIDRAVRRSESARAARAGLASATESARAAGRLPDPMLGVGIENLPVTGGDRLSTTADSMTMKRIGISQEWLSSDKRDARRRAAQAAVDRETGLLAAARAETRLQTALAFLDACFAARMLELATLAEHHLHEESEAAKARLASAAGSSQDVLAMTSAQGVAADEAAEIRQGQATASLMLARWTGDAGDERPQAAEMPPPPGVDAQSGEAAFARELTLPTFPPDPTEAAFVADHPDVVGSRRDVDVARLQAAVTAADRSPNWTWQASYGQRQGYSDMVSVGVSIPLPVAPADRQDRETAARLALVDQAEARLSEVLRAASAEYRSLVSDRQRLGDRIQRWRDGVIAPTLQRVQVALAGYRSNQTSLAALFEARHAEVDASRKLLALERELARVQARLAFRSVRPGAPG